MPEMEAWKMQQEGGTFMPTKHFWLARSDRPIHKNLPLSNTPHQTHNTSSSVTLYGFGTSQQGPGKEKREENLGDAPKSLLWPGCQGPLCSGRRCPHKTKPRTKSDTSFYVWRQHYVEQEAIKVFSFNPNIPNKLFEKLLTEATFYTSDSLSLKLASHVSSSNHCKF